MPHGTPAVIVARRPAKHWLRSRTLIVNAIALGLIVAESHLQLLQGVLPLDVYQLAAFVLPVVNAMLRLVTNTGVSLRPAADGAGPDDDAPDSFLAREPGDA
jgi:hypothetical protein